MMITETVAFIFGGAEGNRQAPISITQAINEKKIRVRFEGSGSFSEMKVVVERAPSFPQGPLKVIVPAGTCISPNVRGTIEFPSFNLPKQNLEI
jgi:hypothetical protein